MPTSGPWTGDVVPVKGSKWADVVVPEAGAEELGEDVTGFVADAWCEKRPHPLNVRLKVAADR